MEIPNRYQFVESLDGIGGMSKIGIYNDKILERKVVIKALSPNTDAMRLLDELRALQHIRSDYVVQVFDIVPDAVGDPVALVEEYIPGSGLDDYIGNVTTKNFVEIGYQISAGLCEVHAHGIIHRDLKPDNCKFDNHSYLKIFDFGLARFSGDNDSTVNFVGTPGFMAPELFSANLSGAIKFGPAVDVFAFAAIMLLLVKGKLPKSICSMPPKLPSLELNFAGHAAVVPTQLISILNRSFHVNPKERPTAEELKNAFQKILLHGRHNALMHSVTGTYHLSQANPNASISVQGLGGLKVTYDGNGFVISKITGAVFVNNGAANDGDVLPAASVIVLGPPELKYHRVQLTFDISHPAVVL
jgi:serine/threonine-protein kinase